MDSPDIYPEYQLWRLLSSTYRRIDYSLEKPLQRIGLTTDIAGILYLVDYLHNYATPTAIAKLALRKPQTITSRLEVMVKKGLLVKTRDESKKNMFRVSMTEKGKQAFLKSMTLKRYSRIMSILPEEKQKIFIDCLMELREHTKKLR
jgi:DNA-binding MarR family transcriptional regulator